MEKSWRKILWEKLVGNLPGNLAENLVGNLAGKSCEEILQEILWEILQDRVEGKSQFKKSSDWQKFSIWNRVMGSQPIRIQLGKFGGKSWRKILSWEKWEKLVGNLAGNLVGQGGWEKVILRKAVIGRNLAFGIG